ncbi:hypothetical protein [Aurantimonas coralicida]|uniref:hypothetical protein n=1 Tax=Aurantimonas coralicida TaxID=182270 RepID=UPI001E6178B6|nr:hypothetical protein [Aurantimonas coralicida]MCD1645209.1 hypothetical protein [Aurantimonas coralicida]
MTSRTITHCDDLIDDPTQPECLRDWLRYQRLPAVCKHTPADCEDMVSPKLRPFIWRDPPPVLYADHAGRRVRCKMASRFGDIGITPDHRSFSGYSERVAVDALSNFGTAP